MCVCLCALVGSGLPERMCMCVPLSDHGSSACMCVHAREHTCDVNKDEPICSAKFEYSLCVCGYVKANVYVIVRDLCHVRRGKWLVMHARPCVSDKQS